MAEQQAALVVLGSPWGICGVGGAPRCGSSVLCRCSSRLTSVQFFHKARQLVVSREEEAFLVRSWASSAVAFYPSASTLQIVNLQQLEPGV